MGPWEHLAEGLPVLQPLGPCLSVCFSPFNPQSFYPVMSYPMDFQIYFHVNLVHAVQEWNKNMTKSFPRKVWKRNFHNPFNFGKEPLDISTGKKFFFRVYKNRWRKPIVFVNGGKHNPGEEFLDPGNAELLNGALWWGRRRNQPGGKGPESDCFL